MFPQSGFSGPFHPTQTEWPEQYEYTTTAIWLCVLRGGGGAEAERPKNADCRHVGSPEVLEQRVRDT